MKKIIIFMVREYNHLDQITPIIDTLINKYKIIILLSDKDYNYSKDMNLNYLKNKYVDLQIVHLYTFYFQDTIFIKYVYSIYSNLAFKRDLETSYTLKQLVKIPAYFLNKILNNFIKHHIISFEKILLTLDVKRCNCIVVTDFGGDKLYEQILKQLKQLDIISVGILHGLNVHTNKILIINQLSINEEKKNTGAFHYLDYLTYMITYCKEGYNHTLSQIKRENIQNIFKLPTLRYTKYWINIKLKNEKIFKTNMDDKLKIVYMVTSENYNMWIEEEFRSIKMISQINDINIVIKPHPRTLGTVAKMYSLKSNNFTIVNNDISSSSLINWCDIVMISSSSILIECITKRKPIIYMKYLHCNSINIEQYKSLIYQVDTRDDVLNVLELFKRNRNHNKIDKNELNEYLKNYILNDNYEENSNKYIYLFEKIFNTLNIKELSSVNK